MMNKNQLITLLSDIRFWILFFFAVRLLGITDPPIDFGHSWRQAFTSSVARNFLDIHANILYPRLDNGGNLPGITGCEFPFYNYLIYICHSIFGYTHWSGRLINLIVSSIGFYYFYLIVKNVFDKRVAFNATILLIVSIWIVFVRKIMPDTFSVSLVIIGLYYCIEYLKNGKNRHLFLFFLLNTLGILSKIPALCLMSGLAIVPFIHTIEWSRKIKMILVGSLSFLICAWWYFYWVPYLNTYGTPFQHSKGIMHGLREIQPLLYWYFRNYYFCSFYSYVAITCFGIGFILLMLSRHHKAKIVFGIITFTFVIFTIKTGNVFPHHNYYMISYVPAMAIVAGYFLAKLPQPIYFIILGIITYQSYSQLKSNFVPLENRLHLLELENIVTKHVPKNDLIFINGGPSPLHMYFTRRKGWTAGDDKLDDAFWLNHLKELGAKYIVVDKTTYKNKIPQYVSLYEDDNFEIYKMSE